jgi:hypothetical protein
MVPLAATFTLFKALAENSTDTFERAVVEITALPVVPVYPAPPPDLTSADLHGQSSPPIATVRPRATGSEMPRATGSERDTIHPIHPSHPVHPVHPKSTQSCTVQRVQTCCAYNGFRKRRGALVRPGPPPPPAATPTSGGPKRARGIGGRLRWEASKAASSVTMSTVLHRVYHPSLRLHRLYCNRQAPLRSVVAGRRPV